jgi:drug/metabolite transporter (DMT)-like permease
MSAYLGELAAIATSFLFSASSVVNTLAGRQVGSAVLNRMRLVLAIGWLLLTHALLQIPLPLDAGAERWFWLSISGIIGLAIGDAFLFQAFIWIGPRLAMLLMALAPAMAAIMAGLFLGEVLSYGQWIGIGLTLVGIAVVVLDRNHRANHNPEHKDKYLIGLLFGLGAAVGQALGQVTAKRGLYGDFSALSGTLIRMVAAAITLWGITILRRQAKQIVRPVIGQPRAAGYILLGSFFGPFLGVTFSLFALQHTQVGVASTLAALSPIVLLPVSYFVFKERFGWSSILGTAIAMLGVALIFLV